MEKKDCSCGGAVALIYACSGGSDVGEISDRAARLLTKDGVGKMTCIAGIGGGVPGLVKSAEAAARRLVIDGCPLECAKKTMEKAGISSFAYFNLVEAGLEKGRTKADEENIRKAARMAAEKLNAHKE